MAYYIVSAGGTLYKMTTGGVATALTLPSDVTLSATRPARMQILGRNALIVNGPTRSLQVDPYNIVRPMTLLPPPGPVTLTAATTGTLSGTFRVKYTYIIKDPITLNILAESDFSPESASSGAIVNKILQCNGISISPDAAVNGRRMYRTTTGPGSTYYHWFDVDGNTTQVAGNDMADSSLSLVAAPTELGTPPGTIVGTYLTVMAVWKNHVWAVGDQDVDTLRYSGNGISYGWPSTYGLSVTPVGFDQYGVTGLIPRRDELGVGRRNILHKVIHAGTNSDGTPNFELLQLYKGKGIWAPDSVVVNNDIGYFLGEDGFYSWGPDGIRCVSDEAGVRKWFTTDTYFNRSQRQNAFARYNAKYNGIDLFMAAAGSSNIDRWVFYDIKEGRFFGPHKTAALIPTCAAELLDSAVQSIPAIGNTTGFVSIANQSTFTDWTSAITIDVIGKYHDMNTPHITKVYTELALLGTSQAAFGNMKVLVSLGSIDATQTRELRWDMRRGETHFAAFGSSTMVQLRFVDDTNNQGAEILGYEIPYFETGNRW